MASYGTLIVEPEDQNMIHSTYCSIINSHKMVVILHVTSSLGVNASTIHNTSSISKVLITFFFSPRHCSFFFSFHKSMRLHRLLCKEFHVMEGRLVMTLRLLFLTFNFCQPAGHGQYKHTVDENELERRGSAMTNLAAE